MAMEPRPDHITGTSNPDWISVELSSRRTGMSFQRTRMSADRTLMSVIRTALSLIGFGFTIFQFFEKLRETNLLVVNPGAARHFGLMLVLLGIVMLVLGIGFHVTFMVGLRRERHHMRDDGLIHAESTFPVSVTLIVATALLITGLLAILSIGFKIGPLV